MRTKRFVVGLTNEERTQLAAMLREGATPARRLARARVLLAAAEGALDKDTAAAVRVSVTTVERIRRRFVEEGLEAALSERPRPGAARSLDPKGEAHLIALACSAPPDGRPLWTMQLLADHLVTAGVVESISDETVRRTLNKGT